MDWEDARIHDIQTLFTRALTKLRADHPIFRRRRFFTGEPVRDSKVPDIAWLRRDGEPMTEQDWNTRSGMTMTVFLNGARHPRAGRARARRSSTPRSCCCSTRSATG